MKNEKKEIIIGVFLGLLLIGIMWLLNTDRYIKQNIRAIDKADNIKLLLKTN